MFSEPSGVLARQTFRLDLIKALSVISCAGAHLNPSMFESCEMKAKGEKRNIWTVRSETGSVGWRSCSLTNVELSVSLSDGSQPALPNNRKHLFSIGLINDYLLKIRIINAVIPQRRQLANMSSADKM
jgi:hypothetical protein